jgi:catechol 2,3-dioxygenase-like lactoylglutathione lyase family enzyme
MERAIPILPVEDLATAKAFYVTKLGFRVLFENSENGSSGLLGIERGAIQITLDCPMQGHGRNACVALQVDDADAYYQEWHTKVDVLRAPKDEDWGARTFDLLDPSGNTIFVMGPVTGANQRGSD